jgi:protein SCO1/2
MAAPDFTLRDQDGRVTRLSAQRRKVVIVTFLYTHCRDVCPLIAANLGEVLRDLGASRDRVRVLAVTVDPARDTRPAIREFIRLRRLLPEFRYLTGPITRLRTIWQDYNVLAMARNEEVVDHSAPTLLIDQRGRFRAFYPPSFREQTVLHDVRVLLRGE